MARAIWTGSLSFGLVSVPVGLYSATEDKTVHFNQFQAGTPDRVRNKRVNERTGEEVEYRDIVKGYEVNRGDYVIVTPEELDALSPDKSTNIEVTDFVDLEDIDPVFFQRTYYLGPQGESARRAYALLLDVMTKEKKVGVATFVMRNKEYLVAVRPGEDALVVETMYFADEIRDPREEIGGIPVEAEFTKRELDTAKLLVESMTAKWDPDSYGDTYRERVEDLIERKRKGEEIVTEPAPKKPAKVVDLQDALQRSLDEARRRQRPGQESKEAVSSGPRSARGGRSSSAQTGSSRSEPAPARGGRSNVSQMSKSELYELATDLDVAGRSKMSREQLERAVASAGGSRRKRAS
jgi:DNA end-binding protein Ku